VLSLRTAPVMVQELLRRGMLVQASTTAELNAMVRHEQQIWKSLLQVRGIMLGQ